MKDIGINISGAKNSFPFSLITVLLFAPLLLTACPPAGGTASVSTGTGGSTGTGAGGGTGTEVKLLDTFSIAGTSSNPPNKTILTLTGTAHITKMLNYHWNSGSGDTPGTLSLKDTVSGTVYGPWTAQGNANGDSAATTAPPYRYWIAQPNADLPVGAYEVVDSNPATWSYTSDNGLKGMSQIFGWYTGTSSTGTGASTGTGSSTGTGHASCTTASSWPASSLSTAGSSTVCVNFTGSSFYSNGTFRYQDTRCPANPTPPGAGTTVTNTFSTSPCPTANLSISCILHQGTSAEEAGLYYSLSASAISSQQTTCGNMMGVVVIP